MAHGIKTNKTDNATILQDFQDANTVENPPDLNYAINIQETDRKYKFEIAAPGFKKGDFKIVTEGGLLTITAETDHRENTDKGSYTRREFLKPSLNRDFIMPEDVISNHISSEYRHGILTINLKKNPKYLVGEKQVKVD
jgi:HSP20 family protein